MSIFPYQPTLSTNLDDPYFNTGKPNSIRMAVGDISAPWSDLGGMCGTSPFAAKVLFVIGMTRRYVLLANAVLKETRHHGFLSAYGLLSSGIELLGRCIHPDKKVRQDPISDSQERLIEGLNYLKDPRLNPGVIVETGFYTNINGGYTASDLTNLRNLSVHGASISRVPDTKADIELLHNLRVLFWGVPFDESPHPHLGQGPHQGAIDRYFEELTSGNTTKCEYLASAGITPSPTQLQGGNWPFSTFIVNEIKNIIEENIENGRFPVSGNHTKANDHFQLYY